jgi:hypothetical protein
MSLKINDIKRRIGTIDSLIKITTSVNAYALSLKKYLSDLVDNVEQYYNNLSKV